MALFFIPCNMFDHKPSPLERLELEIFKDHQIEVWIKRDDLLSPGIGGKVEPEHGRGLHRRREHRSFLTGC